MCGDCVVLVVTGRRWGEIPPLRRPTFATRMGKRRRPASVGMTGLWWGGSGAGLVGKLEIEAGESCREIPPLRRPTFAARMKKRRRPASVGMTGLGGAGAEIGVAGSVAFCFGLG